MNAQAIDINRIQKRTKQTFRETTKLIYQQEGPKGFLRGLAPALVKNSMQNGQYFACLYFIESHLKQQSFLTETQSNGLAGSLTKIIQTLLFNPIIVIKTRLEVVGFNEYSGMADACKKIYMREGLGAFFTGIQISLIRDVPFAGLFYSIYSLFRAELRMLYEYEMSGHNVSQADRVKAIAAISSLSSMAANIAACTIT